MKVIPVKIKVRPKYPDQYAIDVNKTLLRYTPKRWVKTSLAGVTLTAVITFGMAGCADYTTDGTPLQTPFREEAITMGVTVPPPISEEIVTTEETGDPFREEVVTMGEIAPPKIATPMFKHGEGIGVYGCVSITAPVFLSEEDAYAIISEEFAGRGLTVKRGGDVLKNIDLPIAKVRPSLNDDTKETQKGDFEFDFMVDGTDVNLEYFSNKDHGALEDKDGIKASVEERNYLEAATALNQSLNDLDSYKPHGMFYDPVGTYECGNSEEEERTVERAENDLRAQVKDFIEWLAAQEII